MTTHPLLRSALLLNGGFSLASGALLAISPETVGAALDVSIDGWLRALGLALIGHAVLLVFAASRPNVEPWGKANLAAVAPYPLLMVLVALIAVEPAKGIALVLADGALIGGIAIAQWLGLRNGNRSDVASAV